MRLPRQPEQTFFDNLSRYAGVSEAGACRRNPERQRRVWFWAVMQALSPSRWTREAEEPKGPQAKPWAKARASFRTVMRAAPVQG